MQRPLFAIISILLFVGPTFGQDIKFETINVKTYNNPLEKFYDTIAPNLLTKLSKNPIARFVPDFSLGNGGSIISIETDSVGKIRLITHSYYFGSLINRKTEILEYTVYITSEFSDILEKLFRTAINQIKNNPNPSHGLDGCTYYFSVMDTNENPMTASIWSPQKKTIIYKIISLCNDLVPIAQGHLNRMKKVTRKIDNLIEDQNK